VDVVYEGPGFEQVEPEDEETVRRRYSLGPAPIVLSVSAHRPHKNLERLMEAMALIEDPAVLVIPGYPTSWDDQLRRHAAQASGRVRMLGWVSDSELEGLYRSATCLAFPSLAEGFGLPVLEAMIRGLPVASSDATSLPELAGEAVLYFDPTDVRAIAGAITSLLRDGDLRSRLAAAGRERAARFTWEAAARGTVASYERALAS
jgi:glycosyltransferase involved in cell wall biosynthesis